MVVTGRSATRDAHARETAAIEPIGELKVRHAPAAFHLALLLTGCMGHAVTLFQAAVD
jgi:hypothetical protein